MTQTSLFQVQPLSQSPGVFREFYLWRDASDYALMLLGTGIWKDITLGRNETKYAVKAVRL
jgi:hypothetical protein